MTDLLQRTVDELIEAGLVYKDGENYKLTQRGITIPLKELEAMFPPGGTKKRKRNGGRNLDPVSAVPAGAGRGRTCAKADSLRMDQSLPSDA